MDEKTVNIVMRMILSPADYERYKKGLMNVDEQLEKMRPKVDKITEAYNKQAEKIAEVQRQMNGLREKAEKLQTIGMSLAVPSAAVIGAASVAMGKYVEARGKEEYTSAKILQLRKQQEEVEVRIGRVIATSALPFLEKAADLAEKLANWAESHPEIIDAALKIAGAGVVAGGAIGLAAQGMRIAGSFGSVFATQVAGGSAEAAAAAAAGGAGAGGVGAAGGLAAAALPAAVTAAALAIGGLIGKGIGDYINQALGQKTDDNPLATAMKAWMIPGNLMAAKLKEMGVISEDTAAKIAKMQGGVLDFVNGVDKTAATTAQVAQSEEDLAEKRKKELEAIIAQTKAHNALITAELDYKEAREKAVQQGAEKVRKILADEAAKTADIVRNGAAERARIVADYMEQAREAEERYEQERASIIRDSGIEIRRIEEDSQRRIAQLKKEFESRSKDAVRNRDALALVQARRDYDEKVKAERDNTNLEIKRRREDIALRLADLQKSYLAERKQRNEALQKALDDQAAKQKSELETAQKYYQAQLETQRLYQDEMLKELDEYWKKQLQILRNATFPDKSGSQSRASGGYVNAGLYRMHDKEFVMNAATTRAAERQVGGALTQENIRSAMVTNNITLPQGGMIREMRKLIAENNSGLLNALGDAINGAINYN